MPATKDPDCQGFFILGRLLGAIEGIKRVRSYGFAQRQGVRVDERDRDVARSGAKRVFRARAG